MSGLFWTFFILSLRGMEKDYCVVQENNFVKNG